MRKLLFIITLSTVAVVAGAASRYDLNGDGNVNTGDVSVLYTALLNGNSSTLFDLNSDGNVNTGDVSALYKVILEGEPEEIPEYLVGGDISMLPKYLEKGAHYRDLNGNDIASPLDWFKDNCQWNAVRVRLFVDPSKAPDDDKLEGVCQDLAYVTAFGKQIKDAGYQFVLDLHYSDTWADPGQQSLPASWKNATTTNALSDSVYQYTKRVLNTLNAAGATPDIIQTGNEITYGMLWQTGHIWPAGGGQNGGTWDVFANYLKKASQACRECCPKAKVMLHVEMSRSTNPSAFFQNVNSYNVDYDLMGLSYYPSYHGDLATLESVINSLATVNPNRDLMIMETGYASQWALPGTKYTFDQYPYSTEGQAQFTRDLVSTLKKHSNVKGLFWWWPEANEYWVNWQNPVTGSWYNGTLFNNSTGMALPAIMELKNFIDR